MVSKKTGKILENFFAQKVLINILKEDKIKVFQGDKYTGEGAGIRVNDYGKCKKQKPQKAEQAAGEPAERPL